jgi:polyphosphate kinase
VYYFANGEGPGQPVYLIGSADLMPRNLDRRVEVLVNVRNPALRLRLDEIIEMNLRDDRLAWQLHRDGVWERTLPPGQFDSQQRLHQLALERARDARAVVGHVR